jgi:MFS family permease
VQASLASAPPARRAGPLINRDFALLWLGQTISIVGDVIFDTTLVLWIVTRLAAGQPWAPLAASGVLLAASTPVLVVGPLAGVFADHWNQRRTMLAMDATRAVLVALLIPASGLIALPLALPFIPAAIFPAAIFSVPERLGAIYAVVVLAAICAQFFNPARLSIIGRLVDEPYRARASGLNQIASSVAAIAAPPLGALLFFAAGPAWALALNALSFAVSFLAILAMRIRRAAPVTEAAPQRTAVWREFALGLRFDLGNRVLRTLLVTGVLVLLGAGMLNTLDVFFVTDNLRAPAGLYTVLGAVQGVGLVVGAVLAAFGAQRVGVARAFWLGLVAGGVVVIAYARQTTLVPAIALMLLFGLLTSVINVTITPLMWHVTPEAFVGRVAAIFTPVTTLASLLSIALSGYLDSTLLRGFHAAIFGVSFGPVDTLFTAAGLLILLGGLYAMRNLRGVRLRNATDSA